MQVAQYVLDALRAQSIDHVFIDLGGLNDTFMPALSETEGMHTVVAAFEGGAAYMADGYARASKGLGVCFGIGGPGVLNMTTALAAAKTDRSSVIAISGEVARDLEGMGGFQDASQAAIDDIAVLKQFLEQSISCSGPDVVPHHLRHVMSSALNRHSPMHLSIPVDVQKAEINVDVTPVPAALGRPEFIDMAAMDAAIAELHRPGRERIVILAGSGVIKGDAIEPLRRFAERFQIPVATTLSGKGAIADTHPLALGVFGYGGARWAIDAIRSDQVDVLMVIGSGLSQRDTMQWDPRMLPSKALIHIDADIDAIGRTWAADMPVVAEAGAALRHLDELDEEHALQAGAAKRQEFLAGVRAAGDRIYRTEDTKSDAVPMHPARVVAELRAAIPDDGILCVDSGAHRAWFAEYWDIRQPDTHFSLTNLGPMGGAIPLAIGVRMARPEPPLVVATGDGCMLMHGMELHTAAREKAPMIVALMNNRAYGNIYYRAAAMGPGPERLTDIPGIDWVAYAKAMGGDGEAIERPDQIAGAVARGLAAAGPYLLDLRIDKTYPTPVGAWRDRQKEWEDND
jgi:acetolactate synthase-1/2/3 large subunit